MERFADSAHERGNPAARGILSRRPQPLGLSGQRSDFLDDPPPNIDVDRYVLPVDAVELGLQDGDIRLRFGNEDVRTSAE